MKRGLALLCICAAIPSAHYLWLLLTVGDSNTIQQRIATSDNVHWLERIASSSENAEDLLAVEPELDGQPKALRVAAYERLGALATTASLRAQKRVAAALRDKPLLPIRVSLAEKWLHPAWHWADSVPVTVAETRIDNGERIVIFLDDILGPPYQFLMRCGPINKASCTRPMPVAPWIFGYVTFNASLEPLGGDRVRFKIVPHPERQQPVATSIPPSIANSLAELLKRPPIPTAVTRDLVIADIERDADNDGWTDIEERLLGLDPLRADSDGDGIDDGRDRSPGYAPPSSDDSDEDVAVLQQAIFAAFGLSESRRALFAENDEVRRVQVWGLGAPVFFNRPLTRLFNQ